MELTEEQKATSLKFDAETLMEQLTMQESRHMRMSALVDYQLAYPDMTIRQFFSMAAEDLAAQDEDDFDPDIDYGEMREVDQ